MKTLSGCLFTCRGAVMGAFRLTVVRDIVLCVQPGMIENYRTLNRGFQVARLVYLKGYKDTRLRIVLQGLPDHPIQVG